MTSLAALTPSKGPLTLLDVLFKVLQENHCRLRPNKCNFLKELLEHLGFDLGYGWWAPSEKNTAPLAHVHLDHNSTTQEIQSFLGVSTFYRRHVARFTWSSAPISDCTKKSDPRAWMHRSAKGSPRDCFWGVVFQ